MIYEGFTENTAILGSFNLNPRQMEAVRYFGGPLLILAGAGTGKTKTLTSKIALLIASGLPASNILAITFTNKAAQEMQNRVANLVPYDGRMWIHTFHALGARLLRQFGHHIGISKDFVIYDDDDQKKLLQICLQELGLESEKNKINLFLNIISRAKDDLLDAESYAIHAAAKEEGMQNRVAEIYLKYQQKLKEAGALDFGDLIVRTAELIKNCPEVRQMLQNKFKYILVDEYQDTNHAQYVLVKMLCEKHRNLCVVGDPDQSVYGWRGADIRNIMEFEKDFKDAKTVILEQNYRSTSLILKAANAVIKHNKNRKPKDLWTSAEDGAPPKALEYPDEKEEARGVAGLIKRYTGGLGFSYNDIAVFYRTNAQSRNFEEAFRNARIPYKIIGSVRFYDRKEVKDALAYLKLMVMPSDTVSLLRVMNLPPRGIGKTAVEKLQEYAKSEGLGLYDALLQADKITGLTPSAKRGMTVFTSIFEEIKTDLFVSSPSDMFEQIMMKSGYWKMTEDLAEKDPAEAQNRLGNLQELVNAIKDFEENCRQKGEQPTLPKYLEEVMLASSIDQLDPDAEAATLMTVHLAKGLEFPIVFLTGMEENLFPINSQNSSDADMEEERRLAYVGMTRARRMLYLTWADERMVFGQTYSNFESRFLGESGIESVPQGHGYGGGYAAGGHESRGYAGGSYGYRGGSHGYGSRTGSSAAGRAYGSAPSAGRSGGFNGEASGGTRPAPLHNAAKPQAGSRAKGRRVNHPALGTGTVVSTLGSGEFAKITIKFDSGVQQTFMLKYAPLKMIEE
jgi:DNA helicase-2/ATP-dependent DNA helicase PcrA